MGGKESVTVRALGGGTHIQGAHIQTLQVRYQTSKYKLYFNAIQGLKHT